MARFRNLPVGVRRDRDNLQPFGPRLESDFDGRRVKPAVGEGDKAIPRFEPIAFQEYFGVSFASLQPQEFPRPAGADDIEPHQARVIERVETDKAAVTRVEVKDRDHGMAGSIGIYPSAAFNRPGHDPPAAWMFLALCF
jgi:hypothetical protein